MATSAVNAVTWMSQLSLQWMSPVEDRNLMRIRFYISVSSLHDRAGPSVFPFDVIKRLIKCCDLYRHGNLNSVIFVMLLIPSNWKICQGRIALHSFQLILISIIFNYYRPGFLLPCSLTIVHSMSMIQIRRERDVVPYWLLRTNSTLILYLSLLRSFLIFSQLEI